MAHKNLMHIVCLVLQRMGKEQCEQNMWAINLKNTVYDKLSEEALNMGEAERNEEVIRNNHKIYKYIK